MQTVKGRLQTVDCIPGTKCRLQTEHKMQIDKKTIFYFRNVVTFDFNLPIVSSSP